MHIELFEHCGALYCSTSEHRRTVLRVISAPAERVSELPEYRDDAVRCPTCGYPNAPDFCACVACGDEC